jgi:protein-disulfide isomerase
MRNIWLSLVALSFAVPLLAAPTAAHAQGPAPTVTAEDHVLGKADAPITIIEYASLTCPHCAEFDRDTLPKVKEAWIDTGKAKLVFRDFPLDGLALRAAMVAHCWPADRYFGFIDTLFQTQITWARAPDPHVALGRIAKLGGISDEQFENCLKDEKLADSVAASGLTAQKQYGVDSTPTFFINGVKVLGAVSYTEFDKALSAALSKS